MRMVFKNEEDLSLSEKRYHTMAYENAQELNLQGNCFIEDHSLGNQVVIDYTFEDESFLAPFGKNTYQSPTMLSLHCAESVCDSVVSRTTFETKQDEKLLIACFDSVEIPQEIGRKRQIAQQRREPKHLIKRRRSLDDEYQIKKTKREKHKLTIRRKSVDGCINLSRPETPKIDMASSKKILKRANLWTYEEEVFLVAAVMECFLRRGSLTSNKGRDGCWQDIKSYFDQFLGKYNKANDKKTNTNRAASALYRHFKTLKERISKDPSKDLREYYRKFQTEYNAHNCLLQN